LAGLLTARAPTKPGRAVTIRVGLAGAALAWLGVGYGGVLAATVAAAFVVRLLATAALIRLWAVLADEHGERRAVAMTEGEVTVSFGGIVAPLLIGALAASALGWRSAFAAGAAITLAAVLVGAAVRLPAPPPRTAHAGSAGGSADWLAPTLAVILAIVALEFSLTFWLASDLSDDVGLSRRLAALMVSVLFAANLAGRVLASRLARRASSERLLAGALGLALVGLPVLLLAHGAAVAAIGLAVAGAGIGAMFPLTSSLHVGASRRGADAAIGQVLAAASIGQVSGPVIVAVLAQALDLRAGLVTLPVLVLLAMGGLRAHVRRAAPASAGPSSA
jgi:fucose permease